MSQSPVQITIRFQGSEEHLDVAGEFAKRPNEVRPWDWKHIMNPPPSSYAHSDPACLGGTNEVSNTMQQAAWAQSIHLIQSQQLVPTALQTQSDNPNAGGHPENDSVERLETTQPISFATQRNSHLIHNLCGFLNMNSDPTLFWHNVSSPLIESPHLTTHINGAKRGSQKRRTASTFVQKLNK